MACDKPTGDCTNVSPCGSGSSSSDCGCDENSGSGIPLPKCQDVSLVPGAYTNATVVINASGCISQVTAGETPVYTPDDCCGGESSGTGGTGARGPKGDPGPGSTVSVDPVIIQGSGTSWTVQNIGTSSAAIFKFTAPADNGASDCCPSGITASVCRLVVEDGQVKQLPPSLVTSIETTTTGTHANEIVLVATENSTLTDPCGVTITLNLDAFYEKIKKYIDDEITALQQKIDSNAYGVGINGNLAYNSSTADKLVTIKNGAGDTISTVTVPAGGSITLPDTGGETYFVYAGTDLLGAYQTAAPSPP